MKKNLFFKNFIIELISNIYAYLINLNLYLINNGKKKYFYNHSLGFGDSFTYYLKNYQKILKKNNVTLSFGSLTLKSSEFFFSKEKNKKIFFFVPNILYYQITRKLLKLKNFKPLIFGNFSSEYQFLNSNKYKKIITKSLKKHKISNAVSNLTKYPYFCLFIKHYNTNKNDLSGSSSRQTSDLKPIKKIITYLKKKKINTVILGTDSDLSVKKLKLFAKKNKLYKNISFLVDISPNYPIKDQVYLALKSKGYIGSSSGPASIFYFLRKKLLIINSPIGNKLPLCKNKANEKKFIKYLYKYTYLKKKLILDIDQTAVITGKIYETSYEDIKKEVNSFMLSKQ